MSCEKCNKKGSEQCEFCFFGKYERAKNIGKYNQDIKDLSVEQIADIINE